MTKKVLEKFKKVLVFQSLNNFSLFSSILTTFSSIKFFKLVNLEHKFLFRIPETVATFVLFFSPSYICLVLLEQFLFGVMNSKIFVVIVSHFMSNLHTLKLEIAFLWDVIGITG